MLISRLQRFIAGAIMAAIVAAMVAAPGVSYAKTVVDVYEDGYTPKNPVQDNITRLEVYKLEKGSRDPVKGAVLQIIKKETGEVIAEWTSDGTDTPHEIARNAGDEMQGALDVNVEYILREVSVPDGYEKAQDVVFMITSDENFNTAGEIISGGEDGNAESGQIRGSGTEQAFVISLFDEATVNVTEEERRTRQREIEKEREQERQNTTSTSNKTTITTTSGNSTTTSSGGSLTKTGDSTSYLPVLILVAAGLGLLVAAYVRRKRDSGNK